MDEGFREHVESLVPKLATLLAQPPVTVPTLPRQMPRRGVYLFSDGHEHAQGTPSESLQTWFDSSKSSIRIPAGS